MPGLGYCHESTGDRSWCYGRRQRLYIRVGTPSKWTPIGTFCPRCAIVRIDAKWGNGTRNP